LTELFNVTTTNDARIETLENKLQSR